jgi:hypothetical protein
MADQTDSFLREIQEDIRREQMAQIWSRYGTYIIAAAALIIVAVAGYQYVQYQRSSAAQTAGARFEEALRLASSGKSAEAQQMLDGIVKESPRGYGALARLRVAGDMAKSGKKAEAIAAYEAVHSDRGTDELFRDFAALQIAMLKLDSADWTEMQNRLNDLMNDRNPFRASARELWGWAAYRAGRLEDARKTFEQLLADGRVPPSMIERAQLMLSVLAEAEMSKASDASGQGQTPQDKGKTEGAGTAPEKK